MSTCLVFIYLILVCYYSTLFTLPPGRSYSLYKYKVKGYRVLIAFAKLSV